MGSKKIQVPDIGSATATVIEIGVKPGDAIQKEAMLIVLESDKASMEIPAEESGTVISLNVKVGDTVSMGDVILLLETAESAVSASTSVPTITAATTSKKEELLPQSTPSPATEPTLKTVLVPDIGSSTPVAVIEVCVQPGALIKKDDTLIVLESDKATMEIPAPYAGEVKTLSIQIGDKVSTGAPILEMLAIEAHPASSSVSQKAPEKRASTLAPKPIAALDASAVSIIFNHRDVHAGPGVRRLARELGVDLTRVKGTGSKNRITKEDVHAFVKGVLARTQQGTATSALPTPPVVDFAKFGEIEIQPLNRIKKLTGTFLSRNWLLVPHVTQFNEADITDLEHFRKSEQKNAEKEGLKLTPLVFLMKAVVACLKAFPRFNASLDPSGEQLILKKYFHIGVAVDTPEGLVVPVIRDVDQKGLLELAKELADISAKARSPKGLSPTDMQGGCFTISSLGGIGGTAFTPIVNMPDVAILGVSKAAIKPVYQDDVFVPRLMLPLSLSYDHRVIDGAEGARFIVQLAACLSDIPKLLL